MILLYIFDILLISRFGFEGWIWVLIASVPDICILFTYQFLHIFRFILRYRTTSFKSKVKKFFILPAMNNGLFSIPKEMKI